MSFLFSVIMPVYNAEKTLERAIKSILNDYNSNVELVIVNDGSTDNSEMIIHKYLNDSRVSYYYQENAGVSAARNYALSVAKGDYIAFLDSDDYYSEDAFKKLSEYIQHKNIDMMGFGYYSESFQKEKLVSTQANSVSGFLNFHIEDADKNLEYIFKTSKILLQTSWNKIFKRSIIIDNDIRFEVGQSCYENLTFVFRYMKICDKIAFVPDILYFYCSCVNSGNVLLKRHGDNLTSNVSICFKAFVELCDKYNYSKDFRTFMYEQFLCDYIYCSRKIFLIENKLSVSKRLELFSAFLDDEIFLYLRANYFGNFRFYKTLYCLHNMKLDIFAYVLYKRRLL